jgi:PAS domain S-box-containing protein
MVISSPILLQIIENFSDGLVILDAQQKVIYFNEVLLRLLNWERSNFEDSAEEFLSHFPMDMPPVDEFSVDFNLEDGGMRTFRCTIVYLREGRDEFTLLKLSSSYGLDDGSMRQIDNLKHKLSASEKNYDKLFNLIISPIIISDETGRIVNINKSAEELYCYERNDVIGQSFDDIFCPDGHSHDMLHIIQNARRNNGRFVEIGVPRKNSKGEPLFTYATYSIHQNADSDAFAVFIIEKDLTGRVELEKQLKDSLQELRETQAAAILGFAHITEFRDHGTGCHLERLRDYTRILARGLREHPKYANYIDDAYIEDLSLSAVLHDIGKVGIADSILLKAGKLAEEEFEKMKSHARLGGEALSRIASELKHESFLTLGKEVAYYHHEKWDGTGYPEGLSGEKIPLSARIVALADVYDALISERPYKRSYTHEEAVAEITSQCGKHFDPEIVDVFTEKESIFNALARKYRDKEKQRTGNP